MSKKAGITQSALSQIENGNRMPSLIVLKQISNVLGQTVEALLGESESIGDDKEYKNFYKKYEILTGLSDTDQTAIIQMAKHLSKKTE